MSELIRLLLTCVFAAVDINVDRVRVVDAQDAVWQVFVVKWLQPSSTAYSSNLVF